MSTSCQSKALSVLHQMLCLLVHEAGLHCFGGVEDDSIAKGKRDYICLVDNMLTIVGSEKTSKGQMAEGDSDLIQKHLASDRAVYGRLQYIILIGTAGPDLKLNAMSITPGSALQELFPAMEVRAFESADQLGEV